MFPNGTISFSDQAIRYDPLHSGGPGPTDPQSIEPTSALDLPDFPPGLNFEDGSVALGNGGLLEMLFVDNALSNRSDATPDVHVFEVGSDVEDTFLAARPTPETKELLKPICDLDGDGIFEQCDFDFRFPGDYPHEF